MQQDLDLRKIKISTRMIGYALVTRDGSINSIYLERWEAEIDLKDFNDSAHYDDATAIQEITFTLKKGDQQ